jgi:hypothetical protein
MHKAARVGQFWEMWQGMVLSYIETLSWYLPGRVLETCFRRSWFRAHTYTRKLSCSQSEARCPRTQKRGRSVCYRHSVCASIWLCVSYLTLGHKLHFVRSSPRTINFSSCHMHTVLIGRGSAFLHVHIKPLCLFLDKIEIKQKKIMDWMLTYIYYQLTDKM